MVKRQTDQKIRTSSFQARNERIETAVLVETQKKRRMSAVKGNKEIATSGKLSEIVEFLWCHSVSVSVLCFLRHS